jgi:hypothetical protein
LAGAAGTTAINAATYLDMAVRGRPASSTPQQTVEVLTSRLGIDVPGQGDSRRNRVEGLGPLAGIATGVGVGVAAGVLVPTRGKLLRALAVVAVAGAAMAASDVTMVRLGVTDPAKWTPQDWLADAIPHVIYGVVTVAALRRLRDTTD